MKDSLNVNATDGDSSYNVTFHTSKGFGFPFQLNLAPDVAEKLHQSHLQIMAFETDLMNWMALSDENAKLFLKDPFAALEKSGVSVPKEVVENLKNASNLLINHLKK